MQHTQACELCVGVLGAHTHRGRVLTQEATIWVQIPALWPLSLDLGQHTHMPSGRENMAFPPAFLTLASPEGMCGPAGTWHGAAWVRDGRQLASGCPAEAGGSEGRGSPAAGRGAGPVMALNNPICCLGRWNF